MAFSIGVDATVLTKAFQYSSKNGAIIGGVFPNNFIDVRGKSNMEINSILKDCVDGKYGVMANEVKVAGISFQDTPVDMYSYLVVAGNAQTINENNSFGERIVKLSQEAAKSTGNTVVLNQSTDGVSCEVVWDKQSVLDY